MRTITEKNLKNHLGKHLWVEREGVVGNIVYQDIEKRVILEEGKLFGILSKDEQGFYLKLFRITWEEGYGTRVHKQQFLDEPYRLQNGDIIHLYAGERIVRLSP